jgi:hypothetical protein
MKNILQKNSEENPKKNIQEIFSKIFSKNMFGKITGARVEEIICSPSGFFDRGN